MAKKASSAQDHAALFLDSNKKRHPTLFLPDLLADSSSDES